MSGDVQPRKRNKDKKRRRDEEETRPSGVHATKMGPEDIQLHVHSDHDTGGHWCARVFFFSLLAILLGLIGLILLENRGLADLDTPLSESRFADVLEGWVDEKREVHDEHDIHVPDDHDEHDDHDDHDDHDEPDEEAHDLDHDGEPDEEHDDNILGTSNEIEDEEADLQKDDADNDIEADEGYDENLGASNEIDDEDEDERLHSTSKSQTLTTDAENIDAKSRDTNKNNQKHDIKKRWTDEKSSKQEDISKSIPSGRVSASQLERQVDDLMETYNKLAKTLNHPQIHEGIENNLKLKSAKMDDNDNDDDNQPEVDDGDNDDNDDNDDDEANDESDEDEDEDEGIADADNEPNEPNNDTDEPEAVADEADDTEDVPAVDDDGNEIEPSEQPAEDQDDEEQSSSHNDEPKATSDSEIAPEEIADIVDMKRRFTLITAEEPIPLNVEDMDEHLSIIENIPSIDESVKTAESDVATQNTQPVEYEYSDEDDVATAELALHDDTEQKGFDFDEELLSEEEEELSSDGNEYESDSSVDDSDLLKRLDAKYGKLPAASDEDAEYEDEDIDPTWTKIDRSGPAAFTDDQFEDEIRRANEQLAEDPQLALISFERIRQAHPTSPVAQYSFAKALDTLAELKRNNELLKRAITEYKRYIDLALNDSEKMNVGQFKLAAERCIERARFIGDHMNAVTVHKQLIERFDDNPYYRNQLAVTYLLVNRMAEAKEVLHMTLMRWRDDGFAAVHYGFVLKNLDNNLEQAVEFLRQGIDSGANGTSDGRFYFNLGDALIRLGRRDEAKKVFQEAAEKNLFPSEYQRSLYNVNHLKSQPFWSLAETGYKHEFRTLEQHWERIRDEGLSILNSEGYFTDEAENLRDTGVWKQYELFARGQRNNDNCKRTPFTCKLIETFPAARFCKRGQVKLSVMHPNTHVWPHCGPTNCRLRAHLALKTANKTAIRVATEIRTWTEGKFMVFDDSFEHEVRHNGTTYRLILIVDVWHPDLTADEKKTLVSI